MGDRTWLIVTMLNSCDLLAAPNKLCKKASIPRDDASFSCTRCRAQTGIFQNQLQAEEQCMYLVADGDVDGDRHENDNRSGIAGFVRECFVHNSPSVMLRRLRGEKKSIAGSRSCHPPPKSPIRGRNRKRKRKRKRPSRFERLSKSSHTLRSP